VNRLPLLVAAATVTAAAAGAAALAAPAAQIFNDPSGDSGAAPDVTEVQVGNDVVEGFVVLWITAPNRPLLTPSDGVLTYLDTDLNSTTGNVDRGGADFGIETTAAGSRLFRWDGATWAQTPAPTLHQVWIPGANAGRIEIHPRDLAGTRAFNFYVVTLNGDSFDVAPDGEGLWSYSLASGPLRLTKEEARATPARASRPFTLRLEVGREDTNEILGTGRVVCTARLGKLSLRGTARGFGANGSICTWKLPKAAAGKRLTATITVGYGGASVSHSYSGIVKR